MADKYTPEWAKKLEDWGKEMEAKYGDGKGKCKEECKPDSCKDCSQDKDWKMPRWKRDNHPMGEIVGNIISYFIVTFAPVYFPGFFLAGYPAVRTIIYLSIIIHIAASLLMIVFPIRPMYYLGRAIMNIVSVVSMVVMATIFPFNIPSGLVHLAQFALWVAVVIVAIVSLFDFLNIFGSDKYCT